MALMGCVLCSPNNPAEARHSKKNFILSMKSICARGRFSAGFSFCTNRRTERRKWFEFCFLETFDEFSYLSRKSRNILPMFFLGSLNRRHDSCQPLIVRPPSSNGHCPEQRLGLSPRWHSPGDNLQERGVWSVGGLRSDWGQVVGQHIGKEFRWVKGITGILKGIFVKQLGLPTLHPNKQCLQL